MKHEADRQFFMHQPHWSKTTEDCYNEYMRAVFLTYNGAGLSARINASKTQKVAAYEVDNLKWNSSWDMYFTGKTDPKIAAKYHALVSSLLADTVNADIRKISP